MVHLLSQLPIREQPMRKWGNSVVRSQLPLIRWLSLQMKGQCLRRERGGEETSSLVTVQPKVMQHSLIEDCKHTAEVTYPTWSKCSPRLETKSWVCVGSPLQTSLTIYRVNDPQWRRLTQLDLASAGCICCTIDAEKLLSVSLDLLQRANTVLLASVWGGSTVLRDIMY